MEGFLSPSEYDGRSNLFQAACEKLQADEAWVKHQSSWMWDEVRRRECAHFTEALLKFVGDDIPACTEGLEEFEKACKKYLTPLPPVVEWEMRKGSYGDADPTWFVVVTRQAE